MSTADRLSDLTDDIKRKRRVGLNFGAFLGTLAASKGDPMIALATAKARFPTGFPVVVSAFEQMVKGAVGAGNTSDSAWGSPLAAATPLGSELAELIRPLTIVGRLNVRRVPFNTRFVRVATGTTATWVKEGSPIPFSKASLETVTLGYSKIGAMFALTNELTQNSTPNAIETISADSAAAIATFLDQQFIDPDKAAVANESPASITNGATTIQSTGVTTAQIVADAETAMRAMSSAGIPVSQATWVMNQTLFVHLATMLAATTFTPIFPDMTTDVGRFIGGLPVLISSDAVGSASSTEGILALVHGPSIAYADDGASDIAISTQATVQMDSAPADVNSAVVVSLFQNDLTAVRALRWANWIRRRQGGVVVIRGINL